MHPSSVSPANAGSARAGSVKAGDTNAGAAQSISISAAAERPANAAPVLQSREAYELFLRGRHEWQTLERHRMQDGLQHLTRAMDLDPSLVAARINLIQLCVTQAFYGYMPPVLAADLLCRTADSISSHPEPVEAILPALGWVRLNIERNLSAARWAFAKSELLPHTSFNTRERVMFCLSRHQFSEAAALSDAALRKDPFSPWLHARQPWIAHLAGHAEQSVELARRGLEQFPGHDGVALYASIVLAHNGKTDESVRLAEGLIQRQPHIDLLAAVHAYALACAGRSAEARAILERLQWLSRERYVLKSFQPAVHVVLGDFDAAVSDLRAANVDRCPWFLQMLADPRLKPLHGHAGFEELRAIVPGMEEAARADAGE
jgi:tetratricopeptide (TPR) repeat protein